MASFKIGQVIEMTDGRRGTIRYIGDIHVAEGQFVGIELPDPSGKNDGSVKGERYFTCTPQHGLFARPASISRIISQPTPPQPPKAAARPSISKPTGARPSFRPASISGPAKPTPKASPPTTRSSTTPTSTQAGARAPARKSSISTSSVTSATSRFSRPSISGSRPQPSPPSTTAGARASRDANVEALETKIKHLEKQYAEAKEKLKELDRVQGERNRFEGIIQKLQSKCQSYHQETIELKATMSQNEAELDRLSKNEQEQESILELATLDREMAEERAEQAEAEIETLRQRLEEKELELDILHSEAELLTDDMSDEAKHAAGYHRLQTENERLKEALVRLKEITEEQEDGLKQRVKELEDDLELLEEMKNKNNNLEAQVVEQEGAIELLRQQLDASNASEEIIEELSEQNQQLKEQITEKDSIIQDLENLKELNDELEIQHIEQANDLRMELEEKELALAEQADKFREQDAALADQEQLIAKFRDLVLDLQSRMDEAESMKTMTEEQAKDVEGRFNEVMELNRRLHNANLTSTTKTIMSELQKLRAEEANEELQIVKHYLSGSPEVYQNDSIRAYLCARRVSFKADLSGSLLRNLNMQATPPADADTFLQELFRLDTIQILTQLTLKSTRFSSAVSTSTLEQFEAFRPAFEELLPVEKTVERCLDAIKKDELNYKDTSATLRRSDIILGALNMDFSDALAERPEDETIQRVSSIKSNLELFKSCFDTAKTCVDVVEITEAEDEDPQEIRQRIARPSNHAAECIVVANKLIRTLITLRDDSLYPNFPQGIEDIVALDDFVAQAAQSALNFATDVCKFALPADDAEKSPIPAIVLSSSLNHIEDTHFGNGELTKLSDVAARLMFWNDYSSVLKNNIEIEHGPAPWVTKAKQMEDAKIPRAEAEEQFKKLAADHRVTILQLKERDEIIETKNLEIEHMRAKHREVSSELSELRKDQDEYRRLKEEYLHFKEEVEQKFEQMQRRQMEQALAEEHTGGSTAADAALPSKNDMATEKATAQAQMPTEHKAAVSAYRKENHWMRIRELARLFEQKLVDEPTKREEKEEEEEKLREQDIRRDTMLDLSASISPPDSPVTPSTPPFEDEPPRLPPFHLLAKAGKIEPNPVLDALDDDLWFELADLRREIYVLNTKNMKV